MPRRTSRARAYIAVYRYLFEHDLKPYIYRTDDLRCDLDEAHQRHQRHPERPSDARRPRGSGAGRACSTPAPSSGSSSRSTTAAPGSSLQQNLPATPVTDLRVQRGDVVISTMGRAFWVMDDVSPLRQMAARRCRREACVRAADHRRERTRGRRRS